MRKQVVSAVVVVGLTASTLMGLSWSSVHAQDAPPEPGDVVIEDAQAAPGGYGAFTCASGRGRRELANGGNTITINGGCQTPGEFPGAGIDVRGLQIADGEVRVELRQLSGQDRMQAQILIRTSQEGGFSGYVASLNPGRSVVEMGVSTRGQFRQLGRRTDIADILTPNDWNTLVVRAQGPNFWVLVNDQPVLAVSDAALDTGEVAVLISRVGQPDAGDTFEVSGVFRNLRVSALVGSDQARVPTYVPPHQAQTVTDVPCTVPTGLARDVKLNPAAPGLDTKIAMLAGAWEGIWDEASPNPLPSRLYVERLDAAKATVLYTWGDAPGINTRAGWQRLTVDVQPEGKISWGTTRKFTFWAVGDDTLEGTLETAQFTSKIALHRCPPV